MNIAEWLRHAQTSLAESGCPDPEIDARWIAEDGLGMTRSELKFESDRAIDAGQLDVLNELLNRRVQGEPVQYILESAEFMGLKFYVDRRVLIPRQDTETLVESALIAVRSLAAPDVLDLCAGSGCIGLSIKTLAPNAKVTLADVSRDALEVARKNMHQLNVSAELRHGDLFKAIGRDKFDVIISNPPYIPRGDMAILQREVQFEPALALDGGIDGLDFYRRIAEGAAAHLKPGGSIYLEAGVGEAQEVLKLLGEGIQCADSGIIRDLNGIERIVWARSV